MTASELLSIGERVRSEVSLQTFALNCCVPKTLSKIVLGSVSTTVSSVTDDGHDDLSVFFVVSKNSFEAIAQVVEVRALRDLGLEQARLNGRGGLRALENVVNAQASALSFEEVVLARLLGQNSHTLGGVSLHAGLGGTRCLGGHLNTTSHQLSKQ